MYQYYVENHYSIFTPLKYRVSPTSVEFLASDGRWYYSVFTVEDFHDPDNLRDFTPLEV